MKKDYQAINPITGETLSQTFYESSFEEINTLVDLAHNAFGDYSRLNIESKANFLKEIAQQLILSKDEIVAQAQLETALPAQRLAGELQRTINQIHLFSDIVIEGSWKDIRIDQGNPNREPLPKPDIRHMLVPLGPVAVFGASNFPLAFSVAGGDTISALAAGCPVIFKAHPAHPGTSDLVAKAINVAIEKAGMPKGTFAMVHGVSNAVGGQLITHPYIKAVGFTGSFVGGKALFDLANNREEPIPVFAEMGSINPVFILSGALKEKGKAIAEGLANSITLGVGQFCTNPGLSFVLASEEADQFIDHLADNMNNAVCSSMLTNTIKASYDEKTLELSKMQQVELLGTGKADETKTSVSPMLYKTSGNDFLKNSILSEEVFGPASIVTEAASSQELLDIAKRLKGHLTATVFGTTDDLINHKDLIAVLESKVGRVIINNYPTGVEVCHSMVHGGPFPATTAVQSTSVGGNAIKRFVRPICYQNYPQELLPKELKDKNPLNVWRLVDGELTKTAL